MKAHFVVGGTLEGSLHLWDLREDSSIHKDRYTTWLMRLYLNESCVALH